MKIYHNPRCSKSREALQLLEDEGVKPEIVEYMKETPDEKELKYILERLKMTPEQLVRKNEAVYKENYKGKKLKDHEWIRIMVKHPQLIERPIVIKGKKALIGRPPQKVLELI